ncbi:MAG TPA: AAA family ATPase [Candidatus Binatia bacterium]|nr:AAA family ATPase [Candidatus Binatia bacterium]
MSVSAATEERITARIDRLTSEDLPVGQALVMLDPKLMERHGILVDDVLELSTPEDLSTLARVCAPNPEDSGLGLIRVDRYLRQSLRGRLNSPLYLKKIEAPQVRQLFLQPPLDLLGAHHLAEHLHEHLCEDRAAVSLGTLLYLPITHDHETGAGAIFRVSRIDDGPGYVGPETRIFLEEPDPHDVEFQLDISLDDVGGLDHELRAVLDLVQLPLQYPSVYRQLGIQAPRGIILYGPPGTGKTHMTRALAQELDVRFYYINGPEIVGTMHGETEGTLRRLFGEASHHAPSIVCIDELDAIARSRRDLGSQTDIRTVTQLLSLMDGLRKIDGVIVIGTTNQLETIDPAFRRSGRFDREIYIGPPDTNGRLHILRIHTRDMPLERGVPEFLSTLATRTHGFVGADLVELCREAGLASLRRVAPAKGLSRELASRQVHKAKVRVEDLEFARTRVRPSAGRHNLVTTSSATADEVIGLKPQLEWLRQIATERFAPEHGDGHAPGGVLLYGPPGSGKTLLVHALAAELKPTFVVVRGPEIFSKWLGDTEEAVRHVFELARRMPPAVIFFDQLEAVAPVRGTESGSATADRVVSQLLTELDELSLAERILVVAATNRPDLVDPSILRAGRLGLHIEIPLPGAADRRAQIEAFAGESNLGLEDADLEWLAKRTQGFSGADLRLLLSLVRMQSGGQDGLRKRFKSALSNIKRTGGKR